MVRKRDLINAIAKRVGLAIQRIRAQEKLRRSEKELTFENRISNTFLTLSDKAMYTEVLEVF